MSGLDDPGEIARLQRDLYRCGVCREPAPVVYPEHGDVPLSAHCPACGAWYYANTGWGDPDDL